MATRKLTTGWCQSANHALCPHLMQAHRITPNGKTLREIHCACTCHSEKPRACRPRWEEQQLPLSDG